MGSIVSEFRSKNSGNFIYTEASHNDFDKNSKINLSQISIYP